MTTTHDPQTVIDATLLPPSLTATMIAGYRELAEANRLLGHHDIADRCEVRAEALEYGGRITLGVAP